MLNLTALELRAAIKNREYTVEYVVKAYLDNILNSDNQYNSFITVYENQALKKARELDEKLANNQELGSLGGLPIAIKDNISIAGEKMTCGSKMLENYISPFNATIIEKIEAEDGVVIGKTNLDEFAMGADTKTSYFGVTKNPLDPTRVAGGSSGGSSAAVAAKESVLAVGTDTGGSVRQPSAFCSLIGIKPTYGTISRYGISTMANTFDQPGVFANNVEDAYLLLKTLEGKDPKDATVLGNKSLEKIDFDEEFLKGKKIALPRMYADLELQEPINSQFNMAIDKLKELGAEIEIVEMNSLKYVIETYHVLANGEIAPNMARLDGLRYGFRADDYDSVDEMYTKSRSIGFGDEVKRRIMLGTHILSLDLAKDYYEKALKVRSLIIEDFNRVFKDYDIILSPTSPVLPFKIEEHMEPVEIYKADLFTVPVNLAGLPAISIPMPKMENGLAVGIQFIGDKFADDIIIKGAYAFERGLK